jgi:hypothetical protein
MQKCVGTTNSSVFFKNNIGEIYQLRHMGEVNCGERTYVGYGVYAYQSSTVRVKIDSETDNIRRQPITMMRVQIDQTYVNIVMTMPMILKVVFDCVDNAPAPKR